MCTHEERRVRDRGRALERDGLEFDKGSATLVEGGVVVGRKGPLQWTKSWSRGWLVGWLVGWKVLRWLVGWLVGKCCVAFVGGMRSASRCVNRCEDG